MKKQKHPANPVQQPAAQSIDGQPAGPNEPVQIVALKNQLF